jgi:hypothetical protein
MKYTDDLSIASRRAIEILMRLVEPLYAIVDTAQNRRISSLMEESGCEHQMLYGEQLAWAVDEIGPYLVSLPLDSVFLRCLTEDGWGNNWCIFFTSKASFQAIRRHLRRFLGVKHPDGSQLLFRFYDPRIIRDFLPKCSNDEISNFFGPISSFYIESETGGQLTVYYHDKKSIDKYHHEKPELQIFSYNLI